MNWTTKGVAALVAGTALFCGMGSVTAVALTGHRGTALATPPAAVTLPAPKTTVPAPAPAIIIQKPVIVQQPPAPQTVAPATPGGLRELNNGVWAGSSTSNAFALAVVAAWQSDPNPGVKYVYSPVTGQTYAMTYQVVGAGTVIATGGNGAYVQF
jgi:hypothetical protein